MLADINVSKVKSVSKGGVVSCASKDETKKFLEIAEDTLSESYVIKELQDLQPRIRVSGFKDVRNPEDIVNLIRSQNKCLFNENSEIKCISVNNVKNKNNTYYAVLEVSHYLYSGIIANGYLFIGYNSCPVFDAIDIVRCFKCCGYHHIYHHCKKDLVCPKCAGPHNVKEYSAEFSKCINCMNLKDKNQRLGLIMQPRIDVVLCI